MGLVWWPTIPSRRRSLFTLFREILPDHCQVVWMTTPPIATEIRSGFVIDQLEFQPQSMRFVIMEGNHYAAHVTAAYGFDVLGIT